MLEYDKDLMDAAQKIALLYECPGTNQLRRADVRAVAEAIFAWQCAKSDEAALNAHAAGVADGKRAQQETVNRLRGALREGIRGLEEFEDINKYRHPAYEVLQEALAATGEVQQ